jgi:N,N'-diacetyllegionaminate synthase
MNFQAGFEIGERQIGPDRPCFVIAEAGVNHDGNVQRALDLIDVAAAAGADAVKFQTFNADRLALRDAPKAAYQAETTGAGESQHAMLKRLELAPESHRALIERCRAKGIVFLSTPFDEQSADLLESLGVSAFKTPSGELTNLAFLQHIARLRKPMLVSTGMATLGEVEAAVGAIGGAGVSRLALLHCVSAYPAAPEEVNLRAMHTLALAFGVPAGYSDHTAGLEVAFAAVALGACIIEKHFTLDHTASGPDHRASLEPAELAQLVRGIRTVEAARGDGRKIPSPHEAATAAVARKSLVTTRDISRGERLGDDDLASKRPGTGLAPALRPQLLGRSARVAIPAGTLLALEMLA